MKKYTIEVVKEDRALVVLEAETIAEADAKIAEMVVDGSINWTAKDSLITSVVNTSEVK